jgi:hypothetical protein
LSRGLGDVYKRQTLNTLETLKQIIDRFACVRRDGHCATKFLLLYLRARQLVHQNS